MATRREAIASLSAFVAVSATAKAQAQREISIGVSSNSLSASAPRLAKELGLFEKHGLAARIVTMENSSVANAGLIAKSLDFTSGGPQEAIVAQGRGQKVVIVANVYSAVPGALVLAKAVVDKLGVKADAPVAERFKALDGLLIASPQPTSSYTFTTKNSAGAAGGNPRFTYMAMSAMPAALKTGAIQGFIASAPFWATPVIEEFGVLWVNGPKGEFPAEFTLASSLAISAMSDFIAANPDVIRRVRAVFTDFAKAFDDRPAEVKAVAAKMFPEIPQKAFDLLFEIESLGWKGARLLTPADVGRMIEQIRQTGTQLPQLEGVNPATLLAP